MKKKCEICNTEFDYCHSCAITKDVFKNAGYCGEDCYRISMILQKYGSNMMTALEAIKELKPYNVQTKSLRPNIESYYQGIVDAARPKRRIKNTEEVIPTEDVEVVVTDEDTSTSEEE